MKGRKHIFFIFLIAGIIGFVPLQASGENDETTGRVYGNVKNATTGEPVAGLELELRLFEGIKITKQLHAFSEPNGTFSFPDFERSQAKGYALFTIYQGVDYYGPVRYFGGQVSEIRKEIIVYTPTDSNQQISVSRHHLIISPEGGYPSGQRGDRVEKQWKNSLYGDTGNSRWEKGNPPDLYAGQCERLATGRGLSRILCLPNREWFCGYTSYRTGGKTNCVSLYTG
jgi:hypothetical protein